MSTTGTPLITPPPTVPAIADAQKRIVVGMQSGSKVVISPGDNVRDVHGSKVGFDEVIQFLSKPGAVLKYELNGIEIVENEKKKLASSIVHIYQQGIESITEVFVMLAFDSENAS